MSQPWERADVVVDLAVARAALARFPAFAGAEITYLNEGWDSRVFLIEGDWIFRFPKRRGADRQLAVEIALLPLLSPRLPVAVPRFEYIGEPLGTYPYRFVGYRRLPGTIAQDLDDATLARLDAAAVGGALGHFLAALHGFPAEEAARLGAGDDDWKEDHQQRSADALRRLDELVARGALTARQHVRAAALLVPPPRFTGPPQLIHADVASEHLLLAPPDRLLGVIDWGDVALGDPAVDFAGAQYLGGSSLLASAIAAAGCSGDEAMVARARFHAALRAVEDIHYGLGAALPAYVRSGLRLFDLDD